jgi:hypothetical protein
MFFANPTYLWSLLGVLLPIGIHLWSRRQARTIKVGSIELLEASDSVRSRAIRPNEWWLLALRVFIVCLLALILSGPRINRPSPRQGLVYVVEASLLQNGLPGELADLSGELPQIRLLEKGLPVWDPDKTTPPAARTPLYWQLVPELNALNADSVRVFTRGYLSGIRSKRPESQSRIHWISVENKDSVIKPLLALGDAETAELYTIQSQAGKTLFDRSRITASGSSYSISEKGDSIRLQGENGVSLLPLQSRKPLQVGLYTGTGMESEEIYIEAALGAVSNFLDQEIRVINGPAITDSIAAGSDLLVWLSETTPPPANKTLLYFRPDSLAGDLIEPAMEQDRYRLTGRLNVENTVNEHLPEQLMQLLRPQTQWEEFIQKTDRRQWASAMLMGSPPNEPENSKGREGTVRWNRDRTADSRDLSGYFWLIVLAMLTVERLLALWRKQ